MWSGCPRPRRSDGNSVPRRETRQRIRDEHGPGDFVVADDVYAHIPDLLGFTKSLATCSMMTVA